MRILITRPREDAESFAATLAARGIETTIEPLLTIQPVAVPALDLDGVQAVLFTSANGARCFAAASPRRDLKVMTVGDGSAALARKLGFAAVESAAGDVSSLATLVTDKLHPRDGALLHAAGSSLAGDLKGQLESAGFAVRRVVLYDAVPAPDLSPATVMNLRLGGIDGVALFSPRSARAFADLWRKLQPSEAGLQKVTALCLSAAVAREVKDLDWRACEIATRPDVEALIALIEDEKQRRDAEMANPSKTPAGETSASSAASSSQGNDTLKKQKEPATSFDADMRAAAASDAAAGAAIVAAMPKPAGPGRGSAIFFGLVAGAIAGGAMVVAEPYWRAYLPVPAGSEASLTSLNSEIDDLKRQLATQEGRTGVDSEARQGIENLQAEIAGWKDQLSQATGNSGAAPQPIDLGPIEMRLSALEEKLNALGTTGDGTVATETTEATSSAEPATTDLTALTTRLAELEGKLAAMGDAGTRLDSLSSDAATQKAELETAKAKLETVAQLTERLATLESEAKTLSADLSEVSTANAELGLKRQRAAALVLALGQLRAAAGGSAPFSAELAAVEDLARADADLGAALTPALDPIKGLADQGVPTVSELQASFPAADIAQAAAADAAGDAMGVEASWLQKTLSRLSELVTVRPVGDVEGEGNLPRLARAETRLGSGDLAAAVDEAKGFAGETANVAKDWLTQAEARLTLDAAAAKLATLSAEALAPAAQDAAPDQSN